MDTKGGKPWGVVCVMNWATGIDMYTLMCIKLMTNKNLLFKKINKIKLKNLKKSNNQKEIHHKKKKEKEKENEHCQNGIMAQT